MRDLLNIVGTISALLVPISLIVAGYAVYDEIASDKIYIRKDQWSCTSSHSETLGNGKTLMLVTVCDNYRRTSI